MRSRRDLRLASGLVLFTYITLHLACHAFGLVSLEAAEGALRATVRVWHSAPGTLLLYGAVAVHVGLALLAVYDRRTLRMAPLQALRIVLGLTMPIVLIGHFVATRYAFERFGLAAEYQRVAANLWMPGNQGLQLALLAPGWLHGCLGLHYAFGHRRGWRRWRLPSFGVALLLPVLAGLGFVTMGRELDREAQARATTRPPLPPGQAAGLGAMRDDALDAYAILIGLVAVGRVVRSADERRRRATVRIDYPTRAAQVPRGWTVLEASRSFGIPHSSMCGGRARCTTCRVRVTRGAEHCPPPAADEQRTLARIAAGDDVRLACQLRPTGDIAVQPLLAVEQAWWSAPPATRPTAEREVALLFVDLRLDERHGSAHDTIYALDRCHAIVGAAIDAAGGVMARQSGTGWTALFGVDGGGVAEASRRAVAAAGRIEPGLVALVERLARELDYRVGFSIGLHAGPVVAGMIGARDARTLSVVGEAMRAADRLQARARKDGSRVVVSKAALDAAGMADRGLAWVAADGADGAAAPAWCAVASIDALLRA